jgi:energy-converting hydrogenase Eha subunit F
MNSYAVKCVFLGLASVLIFWTAIPAKADQVYGRVFIDKQAQAGKSLAVTDSSGKKIKDVKTDEYGGYSVFLSPGTYRIEFTENNATWEGTIESFPQPVRRDIYLKKR